MNIDICRTPVASRSDNGYAHLNKATHIVAYFDEANESSKAYKVPASDYGDFVLRAILDATSTEGMLAVSTMRFNGE